MAKKAVSESNNNRVIMLIAAESGSGKSFFVANLKNALIYDTDLAGGLSAYADRIARNGSERIEVSSYTEIIEDLMDRRKRKALESITTLAIDHLSSLQSEAVIRYNPTFAEGTFGKEHDRARKEWNKLTRLVKDGDFNLVCTSHIKNKYENKQVVGVLPDASKNVEADFHIVIQLHKQASFPSKAVVVPALGGKWRRDPEDPLGPVPAEFAFTMESFLKILGRSMDGIRHEVEMATPEQVAEIKRLVEIVKLPEDMVSKWMAKAKADSWDEMTEEVIGKCLAHVQSMVAAPK